MYYHWLGREAEQFEELPDGGPVFSLTESDGFITVFPDLQQIQTLPTR